MNSRESRQSNKQQFKYEQATAIQLHDIVKSLLICSKNSTPYFPPLFSRKLCEAEGLQCNENVFFNLMSNIIDYKINECASSIKQSAAPGSSKKQIKDLTFKSADVQKFFMQKQTKLSRPRLYPQMDVNLNGDDSLMPEEQANKQ